jgi:hypothetical protein
MVFFWEFSSLDSDLEAQIGNESHDAALWPDLTALTRMQIE